MTVNYRVCHTDKWYLVKAVDEKEYMVFLSDNVPNLLIKLCESLNNNPDFTEKDAIESYCRERSDTYVYDFLRIAAMESDA